MRGDIKSTLEFRPAVGEHAAHRPAGALEVRHDDRAQERRGGRGIVAVAGAPEGASRAVGQQPGRARRLLLEHGESRPPRSQADPAQQPLHGAGGDADLPGARQVSGDPAAAPGGRADRDAQQPLHLGRGRYWAPRSAALPAWVHAVDPVAFQPLAPAIEECPGDSESGHSSPVPSAFLSAVPTCRNSSKTTLTLG